MIECGCNFHQRRSYTKSKFSISIKQNLDLLNLQQETNNYRLTKLEREIEKIIDKDSDYWRDE